MKQAVDLIKNRFGRSDVLFDFTLFQSKHFEQTLLNGYEINKDFVCLMNVNENALCLVHAETDYYVYGETPKDILSAVRYALNCNADLVHAETDYYVYGETPKDILSAVR